MVLRDFKVIDNLELYDFLSNPEYIGISEEDLDVYYPDDAFTDSTKENN